MKRVLCFSIEIDYDDEHGHPYHATVPNGDDATKCYRFASTSLVGVFEMMSRMEKAPWPAPPGVPVKDAPPYLKTKH